MPVSPKHNLLVLFKVNPVPSVCVNVVSVSAPKPKTALSEAKVKSSPTCKSVDTSTLVLAFRSIIASPSIRNVPSDDCCTKLAASPNVSLFVLFSVRPVPSV